MAGKLNAATVERLVRAGVKKRTGDGDGLWLDVRASGRALWVFRYKRAGRAREAGLGVVGDVSLANARSAAADLRSVLRKGLDPLEERDASNRQQAAEEARKAAEQATVARTFNVVTEAFLADKQGGWRNAKHRQQWRNTLTTYAYPILQDVPVANVNTEQVGSVLRPIWATKTETASRVRGRIEAVLDYATAHGWRDGSNPARWRGHLDKLLVPPTKAKRQRLQAAGRPVAEVHHPALPWKVMPAFMAALRAAEGVGARALEFAILTAARSGEVRGMRWREVNLTEKVWTVPGGRMKAAREHRVPLSDAALHVLAKVLPLRWDDAADALVFPGSQAGRPLSDMTLSAVIRRMNRGHTKPKWSDDYGAEVVPHGFRSTFRDWCAETQSVPREVAEAALAHTLKDKTEAAYQRSDLLDRRRPLMEAWAGHCTQSEKVTNEEIRQ